MKAMLYWMMLGLAEVGAVDLVYGHFEVHLDYQPNGLAPDQGWGMYVSYDEDNHFGTAAGVVRMDTSAVRLVAGPVTNQVIPSPAGSFARFGASGDPLWILPQNEPRGGLFLGVRATIPTGVFQARSGNTYTPSAQGSVSLRLVSVEGSGVDRGGKFAVWKVESFGSVVYPMDSTDGISDADEIRTIPVASHTHYNWGFTKPGVYRVTFEVFGKLMSPSGWLTKARRTVEFVIPHSSVVGDGACWCLGPDGGSLVDGVWGVGYRPDLAMMKAGQVIEGGGGWGQDFRVQVEGEEVADGVGREVGAIAASRAGAVKVTVLGVDGPGGWRWLEEGQVVVDRVGDSFVVEEGNPKGMRAEFADAGLYRVDILLEDPAGVLPPRRERWHWLAGMDPGFSYEQWAESFETGAGGVSGALASPDGDADRDGRSNREEYVGWMLGYHPFRPDGMGLLEWVDGDGGRQLRFVRDTYRDPLSGSGEPFFLQYSKDLSSWQTLSPSVQGDPTKFFETGMRKTGALGRIWEQRVQFPQGVTKGWARVRMGN